MGPRKHNLRDRDRRPRRQRRALEVSSRLVFEEGRPVSVQGIARDIRERRLAEAALQQHTRELEALNQQLALAHDDLARSKVEIEAKSQQLERALETERALSVSTP
jgi:hypothetical protein